MFAPTFSMNVLLKDFLDIPIKSCVAFSSQVRKTLIEVLYMPSGEEMKDAYQRFYSIVHSIMKTRWCSNNNHYGLLNSKKPPTARRLCSCISIFMYKLDQCLYTYLLNKSVCV